MGGSTDWLSAIGILLSGLILGVMFIYVYVRRKQNTAADSGPDLELQELQAKRDALIQQLRELDDEGVTDGEERRRLELKTAEVLKALDGHKPAVKKPAAPRPSAVSAQQAPAAATGFFARNPTVKGFIYGVASIAAIGGLFFYVYSSSHDRSAGGSPTGAGMEGNMASQQGMPPQHPTAQPSNDPAVKQLEADVAANPDDTEKRIELTRAYLDRDNLMGVFEQSKAVLAKNPNEPRAQTYNAIVRMSMGQMGEAKSMLQTATKTDPSITDAWVALAFIATQEGKAADADEAIAAAVKAHPDQEARLREVLTEMRQRPAAPAQPLPPGTDTSALPAGHPDVAPGAGAPNMASAVGMEMPAKPPAADAVHITLDIAPKAQPKSGVVFVFARPEGQAGGPPVAVKRLNVGSFPVNVDLSSSDSMMGQPLPSKIHIEARLSTTGTADGGASIADPRAVLDGVATKSTVKMTLK